MKMKRFFAMVLISLLTISALGLTAFAEETQKADMYVTIANKGELVVAQEKVTVTDIDGDNVLTVNDALYAAHEAKYDGGAAAGYGYYTHQDYGLSLGKLWNDNSGNFGYYVNSTMCMGLATPVAENDQITAYIYKDTTNWSDMGSRFDKNIVETKAGTQFTLTLSTVDWAGSAPIEDAIITIDGVATEYKTDAQGKVTIAIDEAGTYVISAISEQQTLVPPACKVTVSSVETNGVGTGSPNTGDGFHAGMYVGLSVVAVACMIIILGKRKHVYEK